MLFMLMIAEALPDSPDTLDTPNGFDRLEDREIKRAKEESNSHEEFLWRRDRIGDKHDRESPADREKHHGDVEDTLSLGRRFLYKVAPVSQSKRMCADPPAVEDTKWRGQHAYVFDAEDCSSTSNGHYWPIPMGGKQDSNGFSAASVWIRPGYHLKLCNKQGACQVLSGTTPSVGHEFRGGKLASAELSLP